jgi:hypothetical protein
MIVMEAASGSLQRWDWGAGEPFIVELVALSADPRGDERHATLPVHDGSQRSHEDPV